MSMQNDIIYKVPVGGKWLEISRSQIDAIKKNGNKAQAEALEERLREYAVNKLRFFLPHGYHWHDTEEVVGDGLFVVPPSAYPQDWGNDGVAFLNDRTHSTCLMIAPNRTGKTCLGTIWTLLRLIPCDPNWEIFTENKVQFVPWTGPKVVVVASHSWTNVATLWDSYLQFCPASELGNYAPDYNGLHKKEMSFGDGKPKRIKLECGSTILFLCYTQKQAVWEGFPSDLAHLDEQIPKEKYIGWVRSTTTRGDNTQCCMTLTGHVLDGRPDTGAGGWIKRELVDQNSEVAGTIGHYSMCIRDTPDALITPAKKKELYDRWVNPNVERDVKQQKAAVARYWGGFEEGAGLVFDNFDTALHVIEPLWPDNAIPKHLPKWRVVDFGSQGTTCVSWFTLLATGEAVCYRMLYEQSLTIADTVRMMIEMSYNKQVESYTEYDEKAGASFKHYEEQITGEEYVATILDSRSCQVPQYGRSVSEIFQNYGITVLPACGERDMAQIPRLREWLAFDKDRLHVTINKAGSPRMYFVNGRCNAGIQEIMSYRRSDRNNEVAATNQPDHFIDTCKYFVGVNPEKWGNYAYENEKTLDIVEEQENNVHDSRKIKASPYTGY